MVGTGFNSRGVFGQFDVNVQAGRVAGLEHARHVKVELAIPVHALLTINRVAAAVVLHAFGFGFKNLIADRDPIDIQVAIVDVADRSLPVVIRKLDPHRVRSVSRKGRQHLDILEDGCLSTWNRPRDLSGCHCLTIHVYRVVRIAAPVFTTKTHREGQ